MNPSVHTDDARFLELLERWLSGDFTRSDEQELRALASADDFRREAWEGFSAMPEAQHDLHLERLRKHLHGKPGDRRLPLGVWMAAAAAVVLLMGAIYFLPRFQVDQSTAPMAKSAEQPTAETQDLAESASAEPEAGLVASAPGAKSVPSAEMNRLKKDKFVKTVQPSPATKPQADLEAEPTAPSTTGAASASRTPPPTAGNAAKARPAEALEDKVVSVSEFEQPASRTAPDSLAQPVVTTRKESAGAAPTAQKTAPPEAAAAVPKGGWDAFHTFLRRTARLTAEARNNNVSGNVRLEFTVGPDGKPANVRVVRALGFGCDEEAMRLIRLFDWSPLGAGPLVVEVPFVR